MKFKNWDKTDEVCPNCNQVTKPAVGITKQNLKKMFRKPTMQEWLILIMMILAILGGLSAQSEINQYKDIIQNPQELCYIYYQNVLYGNFGNDAIENFSNIQLIEYG